MKLYHISEEDLNGQILQPRIPDNFLTKQGYEDNKTPRISLCKSVNGCLTAISANLKNKVFNVYLIDESYAIPNIKEITNNEVPDQSLTEEVWVLNPIKLKYGFKIRVLGAYPKSLKYKYGKDWAETYRWKYNVIDDSDVMTKDKALFILKECFIQVKDIDKKGYVKGVGLFGSTARDQRTKESDVDIFLDLDQSLLKLEENSIFGIPKKDWEVILKIFVDNFGVNPHTNKNYVIDVVGKYELRHKWNEAKNEIIMIDTDGKKYTYDEYMNSKNVVESITSNIKFSTPEELYTFLVEETEYEEHGEHMKTVEEIHQVKTMDCWEAVEFQKYYLKQMSNVKNVRSFFIGVFKKEQYNQTPKEFNEESIYTFNWNPYNTHTVSMFEYNNKVCYLEASWRSKQNIYKFNNWNDAIAYFVKLFITDPNLLRDIKEEQLEKIFVYEYFNIPSRATDEQFFQTVFDGKMFYEKNIQRKL